MEKISSAIAHETTRSTDHAWRLARFVSFRERFAARFFPVLQ